MSQQEIFDIEAEEPQQRTKEVKVHYQPDVVVAIKYPKAMIRIFAGEHMEDWPLHSAFIPEEEFNRRVYEIAAQIIGAWKQEEAWERKKKKAIGEFRQPLEPNYIMSGPEYDRVMEML